MKEYELSFAWVGKPSLTFRFKDKGIIIQIFGRNGLYQEEFWLDEEAKESLYRVMGEIRDSDG